MNGSSGVSAFVALTRRELIRFVRQPSRIVAAIGTPALLWLFLASGFADSFAPPGASAGGASYAAYMTPGVATAIVIFSSIFAAMSLIEDRREGFLQSVLVSPAPLWATLGAKTVGGSIIATLEAAVVLAAAPMVGLTPHASGYALALLAVALMSIATTALGLAAAWWVNSSEGFHGVMNLVLMPMWLLSGAFFPASGASGWLATLMSINPMRWSTDALRWSLQGAQITHGAAMWSWIGSIGFTLGALTLAAFAMGGAGPRRRR